MREIAENLPIMDGADRLMSVLKKCGFKIAILSGGFTYFGQYLQTYDWTSPHCYHPNRMSMQQMPMSSH
jgi:phosphoserine phosphatase